MVSYKSPVIIHPLNPFPHYLLGTREPLSKPTVRRLSFTKAIVCILVHETALVHQGFSFPDSVFYCQLLSGGLFPANLLVDATLQDVEAGKQLRVS